MLAFQLFMTMALSFSGYAQEESIQKIEESAKQLQQSVKRTPKYRNEHRITTALNYSFLDVWTLGKFGASASWQLTERAWELNYQRGSFGLGVFVADIGKITEQRLQFFTRSYGSRTSFNWFYGIFYDDVKVRLGNDILNKVSQGSYPNVDLMTMQTAGVTWGFSNRWQRRDGLSFGIDWFEINIPLTTIDQDVPILGSDAENGDKTRIRDALEFFENIPTAALARVYVGYSF